MVVTFNNQQQGSGVAFQFTPSLDVNNFPRVEIKGISTEAFSFVIEYKLKEGNGEPITSSPQQKFPATSITRTIQAPIIYNGNIDELAINFYEVGQSAIFTIESIRLIPQN